MRASAGGQEEEPSGGLGLCHGEGVFGDGRLGGDEKARRRGLPELAVEGCHRHAPGGAEARRGGGAGGGARGSAGGSAGGGPADARAGAASAARLERDGLENSCETEDVRWPNG